MLIWWQSPHEELQTPQSSRCYSLNLAGHCLALWHSARRQAGQTFCAAAVIRSDNRERYDSCSHTRLLQVACCSKPYSKLQTWGRHKNTTRILWRRSHLVQARASPVIQQPTG